MKLFPELEDLMRLRIAAVIPLLVALVPAPARAATPPSFVRLWGTTGTGSGQFRIPTGIAVDAAGTVYVADALNSRIQLFDRLGTHLASWGPTASGRPRSCRP
jgi:hypothetical protein